MTVDDLVRFCELLLEAHATRGGTARGLAVALALGTYRELPQGESLFQIGDPAGSVYVLLRGGLSLEQPKSPALWRRAPSVVGLRDLNEKGRHTRTAVVEPGEDVSLVELDPGVVRLLNQRSDEIGSSFRRLLISCLVQRVRTSVQPEVQARPTKRRPRARAEGEALGALAGVVQGWNVDVEGLDSVEAAPDERPRRPGPKGG